MRLEANAAIFKLFGILRVLTFCNYSSQIQTLTRTNRRTSHPTSQEHRPRHNHARKDSG